MQQVSYSLKEREKKTCERVMVFKHDSVVVASRLFSFIYSE